MLELSDPEETSLLINLNLGVGILSLIGSLWMSYFCYEVPNPKSAAVKIIFAIALSDLLYSISNIMTKFEPLFGGTYCHIEAFIRQFSFVLSLYWATCISILSLQSSIHGTELDQKRFFKRATIIGVVSSLLLDLTALFVPHVGYQRGPLFCWVSYKSSENNTAVRILIRLAYDGFPTFLGFVVTLVCHILAIRRYKRLSESEVNNLQISVYRLLWYPLVMFITFVPNIIDNILDSIKGEDRFGIRIVHIVITHLVGFSNAIVYGIQMKMQHRSRHVFVEQAASSISESDHSLSTALRRAQIVGV